MPSNKSIGGALVHQVVSLTHNRVITSVGRLNASVSGIVEMIG